MILQTGFRFVFETPLDFAKFLSFSLQTYTTSEGNPFGYFPQAVVETGDDEDTRRMVREYDPERELVIVLLKPAERVSTYRVGVRPRRRSGRVDTIPTVSRERLPREYFSQAEAEAKIGTQVRTRVEFSSVPKGATGQVISADLVEWAKSPTDKEGGAYDVAIQWDLPRPAPFADLVIPAGADPYLHIQTGKPLVDWFTKDEYERYLEELSGDAGDADTRRRPVAGG